MSSFHSCFVHLGWKSLRWDWIWSWLTWLTAEFALWPCSVHARWCRCWWPCSCYFLLPLWPSSQVVLVTPPTHHRLLHRWRARDLWTSKLADVYDINFLLEMIGARLYYFNTFAFRFLKLWRAAQWRPLAVIDWSRLLSLCDNSCEVVKLGSPWLVKNAFEAAKSSD